MIARLASVDGASKTREEPVQRQKACKVQSLSPLPRETTSGNFMIDLPLTQPPAANQIESCDFLKLGQQKYTNFALAT